MSIQIDIIDTIGNGGIEVTALRARLGNIGSKELDLAVNSLIRARSVRVVAGRYEVVAQAGGAPSALEEAAASLNAETQFCSRCNRPKPIHEFRAIAGGNRSTECNGCHGKRSQAGLKKQRGQQAMALACAPALVKFHSAQRQSDNDNPERRGDNRDVSTERCCDTASVSETSESHSSSDPREDARTPAGSSIASPNVVPLHGGGASTYPVIADRVFAIAKVRRQAALNRIAQLEVELANQRSMVSRCDQFMELYGEFAEGAA